MTARKEFGIALCEWRRRSGLTIKEVARNVQDAAREPVSPRTVQDWLGGEHPPRRGAKWRVVAGLSPEIAEALGMR